MIRSDPTLAAIAIGALIVGGVVMVVIREAQAVQR